MERMTNKRLENALGNLNRALGYEEERYVKKAGALPNYSYNSGYTVDMSNGSYQLSFMHETTAESDVSVRGTMREVYDMITTTINVLHREKRRGE